MAIALQGVPESSWLLFVDESGPKSAKARKKGPLIQSGVLVPATSVEEIENTLWAAKKSLFKDFPTEDVVLHAREALTGRGQTCSIGPVSVPKSDFRLAQLVNAFLAVFQREDVVVLMSRSRADHARKRATDVLIDRRADILEKHGLEATIEAIEASGVNMPRRLDHMALLIGFLSLATHASAILRPPNKCSEIIIVADRLEDEKGSSRPTSFHGMVEHWLLNVRVGGGGHRIDLIKRPPHFFPSKEMNLLQVADLAALIGRNVADFGDDLNLGRFIRPALGRNGLQGRASGMPGFLTYPPDAVESAANETASTPS